MQNLLQTIMRKFYLSLQLFIGVITLGHIRFITAVEALNGFLLITWSASFTFLAMGRLWPWEIGCGNSNKEK